MDILTAEDLAKQFAEHTRKDYLHTVIIGIGGSVAIAFIANYSNISGIQTNSSAIAILFFLLFGARSIYEMLQPFYLLQVVDIVVEAKPYKRLEKSYDYSMRVQIRDAYACNKKSCKDLDRSIGLPTTFKVSAAIFDAAYQQEEMVLLLSATKNLIGCYTQQKSFIANG